MTHLKIAKDPDPRIDAKQGSSNALFKLRNRDGYPAGGGLRRMSLLTATVRKVNVLPHPVPMGRRIQSHGRPKVRGAAHRPHTIRIRQAHSKGHRVPAEEVA